VEVFENYRTRGMPFVLYLRKYDFLVLHGPMELGPELVEAALEEALPKEVHVLTVQSHKAGEYTGLEDRFDRSAPALFLKDDEWADVVENLIPLADMIVMECFMLGEGVRLELEGIKRGRRWDRTVLLLPPLESPLAMLDNDPLIQMFPRCIWMDEF